MAKLPEPPELELSLASLSIDGKPEAPYLAAVAAPGGREEVGCRVFGLHTPEAPPARRRWPQGQGHGASMPACVSAARCMAARRRGALRAAACAMRARAHQHARAAPAAPPPPRRARRAQGARVGLLYDLVMLLHKRNGAFVPRPRACGGRFRLAAASLHAPACACAAE